MLTLNKRRYARNAFRTGARFCADLVSYDVSLKSNELCDCVGIKRSVDGGGKKDFGGHHVDLKRLWKL